MAVKCVKCGRDAELGFLDNLKSPVFWKPLGYKPPPLFYRWDKCLIQLGDGDFWTGGRVDAYYCPNCKLVYIDDLRVIE